MKIAGIPRNPKNSPNMSDKDMLLFNKIVEELKNEGHSVEILNEDDNYSTEYDAIFHMSRTERTLDKLASCEAKGVYVTNSVQGVKNCSREKFIEIFDKNKIRQPAYTHIDTTNNKQFEIHFPGWLKKSEGWSCGIEDVQYIASEEDIEKALSTHAAKGCNNLIFSEHITGDIIKFYGVESEDFFQWYYPDPSSTKFGLEKINGAAQKHTFDCKLLREEAFRAAKALNINIFGGDCIVTESGKIFIIDFNDFPSFSPCRDKAAKKISTSIVKRK